METILVPLDGTPFGEHALPMALAIARRTGASLALAHTHQLVVAAAAPAEARTFDLAFDELIREQEQNYLAEAAERVAAVWDGPVLPTLLEAPLVGSLSDFAHERGVGLIVMSSHRRDELPWAWLGGVADRLIRKAAVPILVVHPGDDEPDLTIEPTLRHILVPLDGSALAEEALTLATTIGRPFGAHYTLLQAVAPILRSSLIDRLGPVVDTEAQAAAWCSASAYLEGCAARLREQGYEVHTDAVIGPPAATILDYARGYDADLIAISTHGRGGLARLLLGSVASEVLRGATIPVLIKRPALAHEQRAG